MFRTNLLFVFFLLVAGNVQAQTSRLWTEADRRFLLENLERTKQEVIKATENLSMAQWSYKETPEKWSIAQVLEHLGLYERIFEQEAGIMLSSDPEPELYKTAYPDSVYLAWMGDPNPHAAERNATPLGLMKGKDNLSFFLYGRDSIMEFVKKTTSDLKLYYTFREGDEKRRSIHGLMVVHFGHTDRHLKQIERIKKSPAYPK